VGTQNRKRNGMETIRKPDWEITRSNPELSKQLEDALRHVMDPELGLNLMELGLIREITQEGDSLLAVMILTTPFCPYGPMLVDETQSSLEEASSMRVYLEMGTEVWTPEMMEEGLAAEWGLL
jgi:metal-sulfur cluster biosynthetic enzyme